MRSDFSFKTLLCDPYTPTIHTWIVFRIAHHVHEEATPTGLVDEPKNPVRARDGPRPT